MSIADWPEDQRPREKLLAKGAASLTDAELLAIAADGNKRELPAAQS